MKREIKDIKTIPFRVADVSLFDQMLSSVMKSFAGTQNGDVDWDAMINDF